MTNRLCLADVQTELTLFDLGSKSLLANTFGYQSAGRGVTSKITSVIKTDRPQLAVLSKIFDEEYIIYIYKLNPFGPLSGYFPEVTTCQKKQESA